jgi:hypothetical protein
VKPMDGPHNLRVEVWDPTAPVPAIMPVVSRRHLPPVLWGVLGTFLVHALIMSSAWRGTRTVMRAAHEVFSSGSAGAPNPSQSQNLVLLDVPVEPARGKVKFDRVPDPVLEWPALAPMARMRAPHILIPADAPDQETAGLPSDSSDAAVAHAVGIYSGQIHARIERIWRRPRTPISVGDEKISREGSSTEAFQCVVTIVQDATGRVEGTDLLNCNGSSAWQESLVRAINQASPLPAPPNPKVFIRSITLQFIGFTYALGAEADAYEQSNTAAARLAPATR